MDQQIQDYIQQAKGAGMSDEQIEQELLKEASMANIGNRKITAIKKKIVEKAKKDPESVSQLLRSVLREGL